MKHENATDDSASTSIRCFGSSLFSVESELGEAELAGDEIEHGDEVDAGAVAAGLALGGLEQTVEALHKSVGQPPLPVGQDAGQVGLNHFGDLDHGSKEQAGMLLGHPLHPTAPSQETRLGCGDILQAIDVLQTQTHLIGL